MVISSCLKTYPSNMLTVFSSPFLKGALCKNLSLKNIKEIKCLVLYCRDIY